MTLFRFRSIRARMNAWTMLAFLVVVAIIAGASVVVSREAIRSSIDADLQRRGEDFAAVILRDNARSPNGQSGIGPPQDETSPGGPPPGGPPGERPPGIGPPQSRRSSSWTAPAHIVVGREGRGGDANEHPYDPKGYAEALKGHESFTMIEVDGEPRRVFSVPVQKRGKVKDVVQIASGMRTALEQIDALRWTLLSTVVPLGLLLGALASFLIVGRLLVPLRRLNDEAIRIGRGGFGERLKPLGQDEFASLTLTLNGMIGSLETLYRSEREAKERLQESMERARRFTGDASHEIKTPLAVLKAHLGVLRRSARRVSDEGDTLQAMERAVNRMNGLVQDLLVLARSDSGIAGERTACRLDDILREVVQSVPSSDGRVETRIAGPATVLGSEDELFRVFSNLVVNALRHGRSEEPVTVALDVQGQRAVVSVADRGVGIAPEHLPHLFERFYRVDRSRTSATGGTGLGLAICEQIARDHGGEIEVASEPGKGTQFTVRLPLLKAPS